MNKHHTITAKRNHSAFTLVDLIVVITVISVFVWVLLTMLCPRDRVLMVLDDSNLRQIGVALNRYSADHDGLLPSHPRDAVEYLDEKFSLGAYRENDLPADRGDFDGPATRFGGYVFLNLGLDLDDIEKPGEMILAYTAMPMSYQVHRNVLFADGHTERWEEEQLRAALPEGVDVEKLDGP